MITWITEKVAIGEYLDGINEELLKKEKIDCVLSLRTHYTEKIVEDTIKLVLGIPYYHISVGSHQGLEPIKIELRTAAYMLDQLTKKYSRILVHCTAGMDRAPFVVAYWMTKSSYQYYYGENDDIGLIEDYYKLIKKKRPQMREHMEWV